MKVDKIILAASVVIFLLFLWQHRDRFTKIYDYEYFGRLYSQSQYVIGEKSLGGIGDDGLYAFAGYYYITGGDISQVSFESPPLAKYLIGISILLFHNELIINIIYTICLFIIVYLLGLCLTDNPLISAISVFVVSIDHLIQTQILLSLLDLPMTVLFLTGIYFFIKGARAKQPKVQLFLSALLFSLSFTTRFFPILPLLLGILTFALVKRGKKHWLPFLIFLAILMPVIYMLVHVAYFIHHPSLSEFIRYQLWIIHWRLGEPFVVGNIIPIILTGYYRSWWGKGEWLWRSDWSILIPVVFVLGIAKMWKERKFFPNNIIWLMVAVYLLYVAFGTVGVTKFLLPVYPLMVIVAVKEIYGRIHLLN